MSKPLSSTASILQGAHNNTFSNSTFVIREDRIAAFDRLEKAAAPSAFHSFVGRPQPGKCYPNTRIGLLKGLEKWIVGMDPRKDFSRVRRTRYWRISTSSSEDSSDDELEREEGSDTADRFRMGMSSPDNSSDDEDIDTAHQPRNDSILWLRGGAGAGKSAVAQTFAERCEDLGHIVASFFFFSTDPSRNEANRLVATLAYQIARADAGARAHIETVVHRDPHIFNQDLTKQFISLVVNPIRQSTQAQHGDEHQRQCVIIIDGLDECTGGAAQAGIVRAVSDALQTGSSDITRLLPRFLICSRPEEPITRVFRSPHLENIHTPIDLSTDPNARDDIRTFLAGELAEIKATHDRQDLIPASWPSDNVLSRLSYNSSGHFIYAQTIVRLLSNDPRPVTTLDAILGLRALPQRVRDPFAELDELYQHILLRAQEKCTKNTIQHVLGFLAVGFYSKYSEYHHDTVATFLGLEHGELDTLLSTISSLISATTLDFYHKSFADFLHHGSRAKEFHISVNDVYAFAWDRCVHVASKVSAGLHLEDHLEDATLRLAKYCVKRHIDHDLSSGATSELLLGLTQQQQVTPIYQQAIAYGIAPEFWAVKCFEYWLKLADSTQNSPQLVKDATVAMIGILKDLFPLASPALPLLICEKVTRDLVHASLRVCPDSPQLVRFVCSITISDLGQRDFACFQRLLEDEEMGECRLTAERFAEACVFWTTHLTKNLNLFPSTTTTVTRNKRSLIINWSARRKQIPFLWRRTQRTVRPQQIKAPTQFVDSYHVVLIRGPGAYIPKVYYDYSKREVFCLSQYDERRRRQHFTFVLSRIPIMLAKASKSDAVAALRSRAFPPLAGCFPGLTQRVKRALEKYTVRHGYDSPYVDAGPRYTSGRVPREDVVCANEAALSSPAPPEQTASPHLALVLSTPLGGEDCSSAPENRDSNEHGNELIIGEEYESTIRSSGNSHCCKHHPNGCPAIDGCRGDIIDDGLVDGAQLEDNILVSAAAVRASVETRALMIRVWLGHLLLLVLALFGGLDEIYVLGQERM